MTRAEELLEQKYTELAAKLGSMEAALDISRWYRLVVESGSICPNCGADFRRMSGGANLYPHWMVACKAEPEKP